MNDKKATQPNRRHGGSCSSSDRRSYQPPHSHKPKPNPKQGPAFNSTKTERGEEAAEEKSEVSCVGS